MRSSCFKDFQVNRQRHANLHIIHDDIALHKSGWLTYIEDKKTGRDQHS